MALPQFLNSMWMQARLLQSLTLVGRSLPPASTPSVQFLSAYLRQNRSLPWSLTSSLPFLRKWRATSSGSWSQMRFCRATRCSFWEGSSGRDSMKRGWFLRQLVVSSTSALVIWRSGTQSSGMSNINKANEPPPPLIQFMGSAGAEPGAEQNSGPARFEPTEEQPYPALTKVLEKETARHFFMRAVPTSSIEQIKLLSASVAKKLAVKSDYLGRLVRAEARSGEELFCPASHTSYFIIDLPERTLLDEYRARLAKGTGFCETELWGILVSAVFGLACLQRHGVRHGCLRLQTIYVGAQGEIKLVDPWVTDETSNDVIVNNEPGFTFIVLEELQAEQNYKSDVVVLAALLCLVGLQRPLAECAPVVRQRTLANVINQFSKKYSAELTALLRSMNKDAEERPDWLQLQQSIQAEQRNSSAEAKKSIESTYDKALPFNCVIKDDPRTSKRKKGAKREPTEGLKLKPPKQTSKPLKQKQTKVKQARQQKQSRPARDSRQPKQATPSTHIKDQSRRVIRNKSFVEPVLDVESFDLRNCQVSQPDQLQTSEKQFVDEWAVFISINDRLNKASLPTEEPQVAKVEKGNNANNKEMSAQVAAKVSQGEIKTAVAQYKLKGLINDRSVQFIEAKQISKQQTKVDRPSLEVAGVKVYWARESSPAFQVGRQRPQCRRGENSPYLEREEPEVQANFCQENAGRPYEVLHQTVRRIKSEQCSGQDGVEERENYEFAKVEQFCTKESSTSSLLCQPLQNSKGNRYYSQNFVSTEIASLPKVTFVGLRRIAIRKDV